jgi:hypothetical protein
MKTEANDSLLTDDNSLAEVGGEGNAINGEIGYWNVSASSQVRPQALNKTFATSNP